MSTKPQFASHFSHFLIVQITLLHCQLQSLALTMLITGTPLSGIHQNCSCTYRCINFGSCNCNSHPHSQLQLVAGSTRIAVAPIAASILDLAIAIHFPHQFPSCNYLKIHGSFL
jgi:hypothetical protein